MRDRERKRNTLVYKYMYMYVHTHTYIYIYIYIYIYASVPHMIIHTTFHFNMPFFSLSVVTRCTILSTLKSFHCLLGSSIDKKHKIPPGRSLKHSSLAHTRYLNEFCKYIMFWINNIFNCNLIEILSKLSVSFLYIYIYIYIYMCVWYNVTQYYLTVS